MHAPTADAPFPRAPLIAAVLLVAVSLTAVVFVRLTGIGFSHTADAAAVAVRELRFEDRADGGITVIDAAANRSIETITGTQGFVRGTLRGLARERKRQGIGPDQPFRLTSRQDGRLTLEDPATGRRVDLESFGPTNSAVFAQMLVAGNRTP